MERNEEHLWQEENSRSFNQQRFINEDWIGIVLTDIAILIAWFENGHRFFENGHRFDCGKVRASLVNCVTSLFPTLDHEDEDYGRDHGQQSADRSPN
jgi:hypothetical protein